MRLLPLVVLLLLSACAVQSGPADSRPGAPPVQDGEFVMPDGARLPYRAWLPEGPPKAVVLALHGFNDSRDAWEIPAPGLTSQGIAIFAPDQRGFGQAPGRGLWAGGDKMADDAAAMTEDLHQRYPDTRLIMMGESMGAAVLMGLAARPDRPDAAGWVLLAPAVWGRAEMNPFLRGSLWLASTVAPDLAVTGSSFVHVTATDNREALHRLSTDPLTIRSTRFGTLKGLVDLMDAALAAAPRLPPNTMLLYGGKDELVPKQATTATWRALPPGARTAFYENGYHLLLRDQDRALPIGDIAAWILARPPTLPSGADRQAAAWLAGRE